MTGLMKDDRVRALQRHRRLIVVDEGEWGGQELEDTGEPGTAR
jgi:hypothetical protein